MKSTFPSFWKSKANSKSYRGNIYRTTELPNYETIVLLPYIFYL